MLNLKVPRYRKLLYEARFYTLLHILLQQEYYIKYNNISSGFSPGLRLYIELPSAEGGTRTPTPFRAQRPERCVSTNFTTSAQALYYCIPCDLSRGFFPLYPRLLRKFMLYSVHMRPFTPGGAPALL